MQKNGPPYYPRKEVRISIGNIDLFAYSIFKNIEVLSGQGVVQIKPNSVSSIPWVSRVKTGEFFGIACLEKSSYFIRKYRFTRLLYA